ncbi:hypothetical protein pb186bvf_017593 [Paramecium bursaria]
MQQIDLSYLVNNLDYNFQELTQLEEVNGKITRFIYEDTSYLKSEYDFLDMLNKKLISDSKNSKQTNFNIRIPQSDLLRLAYSTNFDLNATQELVKQFSTWKSNPLHHSLHALNAPILEKGLIYLHGQSQNRPILIFQRLNMKEFAQEQVLQGIDFLLMTTIKYLVPQETWIFILDAMIVNTVYFENVHTIFDHINKYFYGRTYKVFVIDSSQDNINQFQKIFPKSIRVEYVERPYTRLHNELDKFQLEKKFGGQCQNLNKFWPPVRIDIKTDNSSKKDTFRKANSIVEQDEGSQKRHMLQVEKQYSNMKSQQSSCYKINIINEERCMVLSQQHIIPELEIESVRLKQEIKTEKRFKNIDTIKETTKFTAVETLKDINDNQDFEIQQEEESTADNKCCSVCNIQ